MMRDFIILDFDMEALLDVAKPSMVCFLGTSDSQGQLRGLNQKCQEARPRVQPTCSTYRPGEPSGLVEKIAK